MYTDSRDIDKHSNAQTIYILYTYLVLHGMW